MHIAVQDSMLNTIWKKFLAVLVFYIILSSGIIYTLPEKHQIEAILIGALVGQVSIIARVWFLPRLNTNYFSLPKLRIWELFTLSCGFSCLLGIVFLIFTTFIHAQGDGAVIIPITQICILVLTAISCIYSLLHSLSILISQRISRSSK